MASNVVVVPLKGEREGEISRKGPRGNETTARLRGAKVKPGRAPRAAKRSELHQALESPGAPVS